MTYLFKCRAAGDVLMLQADGEQLLRLVGKEPAATGIIGPAALAAARHAIEHAIRQDEQGGQDGAEVEPAVSLRQRAWPLLEMLRAAEGAHEAIVWGV